VAARWHARRASPFSGLVRKPLQMSEPAGRQAGVVACIWMFLGGRVEARTFVVNHAMTIV